MIPLKLHLKNFLSYGSELQTIDFEPHHLICLSGKNGHGKSALLDAVTWALWGIARKTATSVKADQGLLRLGQQQMIVILDFALGQNTYRIRREFSFSYGKAQAHLDFGIIDPASGKLIPLTDKTIKDTQRVIEQTINLDFETFTNSAFLKQGQSNEFSKKSSKERKDIFATILGLGQYEIIRKKALEKIKDAQSQEKTIATFQEKIKQELEKKTLLTENLTILEQQLAAIGAEELQIQQSYLNFEKQHQFLTERKQHYNQTLYQEGLLQKQIDKEVQVLQAARSAWRAVQHQQSSLTHPEALYQEQKKITQLLKNDQEVLQKNLEIKELLLKDKEQLQLHVSILQQNHTKAQMEQRIIYEQLHNKLTTIVNGQKETQKEINALSLQEQSIVQRIQELQIKVAPLPSLTTSYAEYDLYFEKRKSFYQKYSAHGNILHAKIKNLQQKQSLVLDGDEAACPLCEQNLSGSRRRFLHQKFAADYTLITHQYQRISRVITALKPALVDNHTQLIAQKKELDTLNQCIITLEELNKQRAHLEEQRISKQKKEQELIQQKELIEHELAQQQKFTLPDFTITLSQDPLYQQLNKQLLDLEAQLAAIQYDKDTHIKHQQLLEDIEQKINTLKTIEQELFKQSERKQQIFSSCKQLKIIKKDITAIHQALIAYKDIPEIESNLNAEKRSVGAKHSDLSKTKELLIEQKGRILNELQKLASLESELAQYLKEQEMLLRTIDDYTIIAHATSKDGIQALLIEEAIPEVEYEANLLLSKLTNNQAQISIESLRDLKKGGTKETLDIKISDASGIRPYELFSGGEAFRIDFALRIAISKLLAKRAGTALQTLIIDEGFGSQDEEGLNHIMDAIHKIQDDFAKVIIVSHLDALKEQFPVHFVVHKSAHGSTVSVIEHG